MEIRSAALIGYYGRGNLGDELMLVCLHEWLHRQQIAVSVVADLASQVIEQHNLPAVQNYPFLGQYGWVDSFVRGKALGTLSTLARSDLVICGGGDVIRDAIGWRTFSFQVEKLVAGYLLGKQVYLLNVGLSHPVTSYGRAVLRWLLPRCRGIIVRDARSVEICHQYAKGKRVHCFPDIVRRLPDLFPAVTHPSIEKTVLLVAVHGSSNVYGKYQLTETRLQNLAALFDSAIEKYGFAVEFFPFQPADDGGDVNVAATIQRLMSRRNRTRTLTWTLDLSEIAARLARSKLVLAMRLHAAVLAATYGVPCILMPYDQKVIEFGKQAGIHAVLTAEMLDTPEAAQSLLDRALAEQLPPKPLNPTGDWLTETLQSIS